MPNNMQGLVKQAQKMQEDIAKTQAELEGFRCETQSGGGVVKVVMDGRYRVTSLIISPEVINPQEQDLLQDLVQAAINEAAQQVHENAQKEMGKVTGGMSIPGLF